MCSEGNVKRIFQKKLKQFIENSKDRSGFLIEERYNKMINELKEAQQLKKNKQPLTSLHYRRIRRFDIVKVGEVEKLIQSDARGKPENIRYFCKTDELFDILENAHIKVGHKRTRVMETELKKKYCNVTRQVIDLYVSLCEQCQLKKKVATRPSVVPPITSKNINSRCQVDLIDMQTEADGEYRFIMNYQDHQTNFTILRALKTKTAKEIADQLMDIFCIFGAPYILQSDENRELGNEIIIRLADLWPGLKLVHGKPRNSERSSQDVRNMLVSWMEDNKTKKWSEGLRLVQCKRNWSFNIGIKMSPHEAMFGCAQRIGLSDSSLSKNMYDSIETEEELEEPFRLESNELDKMVVFIPGTIRDIKEEEVYEMQKEEQIVDDENKIYCIVCGKELTESNQCSVCGLSFHAICGELMGENNGFGQQIICNLCSRKGRIKSEPVDEESEPEKQTESMALLSNSTLPPVQIGRSVVLSIPDVNRGHLSPRNVLAVVIDVNSSGLYQLGTTDGILERLYDRSEFTLADSNFMQVGDVPTSSSIACSESQQYFVRCHCKRYCIDKKCKCRSNDVKCNSKCHLNRACKNK